LELKLLNLDSDWYESEKLCLNKFYSCVSKGGFVYFDDFYFWPGCRKAVEEFFLTQNKVPKFNKVGHSMWLQKGI
jgi:O-methyltransferase